MVAAEAKGVEVPPQELESFLPKDQKNGVGIIGKPKTADLEAAEYDPFTERRLENPTSDMDTLAHLLKASLGTGILAMPKAFESVGLVMGIVFTILVAFICTHCAYILVKAAHVLYKRTRRNQMSFPEVAHAAFETGPEWARKFADPFRKLILISLFATYFGTCSVYAVIIAQNIQQVAENVMGVGEGGYEGRYFIAGFLIPLVLLGLVRNLKYLAPVSMIANVFMGVGLCITMYYLCTGIPSVSEPALVQTNIMKWPLFFSITIFAMEAIGVVMPLENAMKTPKNMLGICGVMSRGMSGVTLVYILLGFLGYLRYRDEKIESAITLNLDINEPAAKIVKVLIGLAVYCTFGLQFYVCVEIAWNSIKDRFAKNPVIADMVMRTILVTLCVLLAIAFPKIEPFIGVIGAFCFSILGLMVPAVIEIVTLWDVGFGKFNWVIWKNVVIAICAVVALIFGTKDAVEEIVKLFATS